MSFGGESGFTELNGVVEELVFVNPDNGFTVIEFRPVSAQDTVRAAGVMPELFPGEFVTLTGRTELHRQYGETFKVFTCRRSVPADSESLAAFLSCGLFPGIGEVTARAIVERFGDDTVDTILFSPEQLAKVRNISSKKAQVIAAKFREYFSMSETLGFFAELGVSTKLALAVYEKYGINSVAVTKKNPYLLIDEVPQLGFKTADRIALGIGVGQNSGSRVCAFMRYYLESQLGSGNVCFPKQLLLDSVAYELNVPAEAAYEALDSLISGGTVTVYASERPRTKAAAAGEGTGADVSGDANAYSNTDANATANVTFYADVSADADTFAGAPEPPREYVFLSYIDGCEQFIADRLTDLADTYISNDAEMFEAFIYAFNKKSGFELNDVQIEAVKQAVENGFSVITGGPGTGKTTIIRAVYQYLTLTGLKCLLAAPTGRAAKRMSEAVGIGAKTVHRLLEYSAFRDGEASDTGYESEQRLTFARNETNPLDADVLIVDESSMLDTLLCYHMLKALKPGSRLVLLGDKDQLPSVGPGNILKDVIASGLFPVTTLTYVYRQSDTSLIALNAQRINSGLLPEMNRRDKDFFMLDCNSADAVPELVADLVCRRLPAAYGFDPMRDIQVLIPGKKGRAGIEGINPLLQERLNPPRPGAEEVNFGETLFRTGDRVMQVKNDYELEWNSIVDRGIHGKGVFNGEMGIISEIDRAERTLTVVFDDERETEYPLESLSELELCYAVTVHKSQGSEFECCVMPLCAIPYRLQTRNILYTAVTRARKLLVLAGDRHYLGTMIGNNTEELRYTCLAERLSRSGGGANAL